VSLKPIGILSIARVVRTYAWLNISNIPWFRTKNPQKGTRIHGASSDLSVTWLHNGTSNGSPIFLEALNRLLECRNRHRAGNIIVGITIGLVMNSGGGNGGGTVKTAAGEERGLRKRAREEEEARRGVRTKERDDKRKREMEDGHECDQTLCRRESMCSARFLEDERAAAG
jgi:hypothetical protein